MIGFAGSARRSLGQDTVRVIRQVTLIGCIVLKEVIGPCCLEDSLQVLDFA